MANLVKTVHDLRELLRDGEYELTRVDAMTWKIQPVDRLHEEDVIRFTGDVYNNVTRQAQNGEHQMGQSLMVYVNTRSPALIFDYRQH